MKNLKSYVQTQRRLVGGLFVLLPILFILQPLQAQTVVHHPDSTALLTQRWSWAEQQARQRSLHQDYWIGYSIQRLMPINSTIGTMSISKDGCITSEKPNLFELIYGTPPPYPLPPCGEKRWRNYEREVLKEIGFFFRVESTRSDFWEVKISTFELGVDFKSRSILWLGRASEVESLRWLKQVYSRASGNRAKENLIAVVGTHDASAERRSFLAEALKSQEADAVRKQAAFYLGHEADREAINLLKETARSDRSLEVRKQAVFALTQTKSTESIGALVDLAKNKSDREVRKEALFWLAQTHSEQAVPTLKEVLQQDDFEIQKHAVFAITQLSKPQSVPLLVDVAKNHPQREIRKEALFWLAQTHSEQAISVLKEAVLRDDFEVQKHAVFAITQLPKPQSVPVLVDIAKNHSQHEIRKEALFWLAQTHSEQAVPALKEAVQRDDFEVQKHAVFAITQLSENQSTPLLIDIAKNHPVRQIRKEAIFWLGQSDDPAASEALLKIVQGK